MTENDVYPINLLTEELKSDEVETRIKTMKRIKTIAQALGPEKTRSELLPFLNGSTVDEDEILVTLSEELGGFVPLVGGPDYASCLLDPLEALAAVEETVVRNKAVESIGIIVQTLSETACTDKMLPLIKRLAEGDWFTSRVSACGLFAVSYPKISVLSKKKELRDLYETLCGDDTPMVRRSAALHLGTFAASMEKEHVIGHFITHFKTLTTDDQDSVRLLAIENCATIGKLLNEDENKTYILPIVRNSVEDRSWRVRNSIAKEFAAIAREMGLILAQTELRAAFVTLLQDAEAEVRAVASKNLAAYLDIVGTAEFVDHILPLLTNMSQDTAPNVRSALSIETMVLAPALGPTLTSEHLVPIYLVFLRDDVVEVRLHVLQRLSVLAPWIPSMDTTILPTVKDLARDLQWRVREAVIKTFPSLAAAMGPAYFQDHLLSTFLALFTDLVAEVRTATTQVLPDLLVAVGSDWMLEHVVPKLSQTFEQSQIYQERVNVLSAVKYLACPESSDVLLQEMAQLAVRGAKDKVPNVRFNAALALQELAKCADSSTVNLQVRPCLTELQNDTDSDVKYYSMVALE